MSTQTTVLVVVAVSDSQSFGDEMSGGLTLVEVLALTGLSHSALYRVRRSRQFPAPMRLRGRARLVWRRADVDEWLARELAVCR
jgi:predicted DNA-binding transcriptional regulator AlpA